MPCARCPTSSSRVSVSAVACLERAAVPSGRGLTQWALAGGESLVGYCGTRGLGSRGVSVWTVFCFAGGLASACMGVASNILQQKTIMFARAKWRNQTEREERGATARGRTAKCDQTDLDMASPPDKTEQYPRRGQP